MTGFIYPFLSLAVAGSIALLGAHLAALFGITYPFEHSLKLIAPGLFIVWLPAVLVSIRLTRDFKQKDFWRAALRGCPKWMQRATWILFGYAWIGFFALPALYGGGMDSTANEARTMSGGLLMFYAIAASILYSATQAQKFDEGRRCLNGHQISPSAKYCDECGAPAQDVSPTSLR